MSVMERRCKETVSLDMEFEVLESEEILLPGRGFAPWAQR